MSRSDRLFSRLSLKEHEPSETLSDIKSDGRLNTATQSPDGVGSLVASEPQLYSPISIHATREKYGLFEFPSIGPGVQSLLGDDVCHVDIIAVHGLGGNWKTTWQASETEGPIWLRDRLPKLLQEIKVGARIRSFGYDSAFMLTSSISDLDLCAQDLIARLRGFRSKPEERKAPIIFIAHSLGGLLVKQALNIAWTRASYYRDILDHVKGCVFLGVPHHGAGLAKWAEHGVQVLKVLSAGMLGNSRQVKALRSNSPIWVKISADFVEHGKDLSFRSFYETEKIGGMLIVDKASAAMHVLNEHIFALPGSDHRTIARFGDDEDQRFSLVGMAVVELVEEALSLPTTFNKSGAQIIMSNLPVATRTFFGRQPHLQALQQTLDPGKAGFKGIVLYGLGGSGKTQIILRYIHESGQLFTAILWINASNPEMLEQSYDEAAGLTVEMWPARDMPNPYHGKSKAQRVTSRLRSTLHRQWLLVIDGFDGSLSDLPALIPRCHHGSVVVTSTKRQAAEVLESMSFSSLEVDYLDAENSQQLLISKAGPEVIDSSAAIDKTAMTYKIRRIAKELNHLPLALEQAGGLLRRGIVSVDSFVDDYQSHYPVLMDCVSADSIAQYDKSIITVFGMVYDSLQKESAEAAALLTFLGALGHWSIPFSTLRRMGEFGTQPQLVRTKEFDALRNVLGDETLLRLRLSQLYDACLVRVSKGPISRGSVSVNQAVTQWIQQLVIPKKPEWLIYTGLAVTRNFSDKSSPYTSDSQDPRDLNRAFIPLLDLNTLLVKKHVLEDPKQRLSESLTLLYAAVAARAGFIYLRIARYEDAVQSFSFALESDMNQQKDKWPQPALSLDKLYGLAVAHQMLGNHSRSLEILSSIHPLAQKHFGKRGAEKTIEISSRLKAVADRLEINQQHHKSALLAITAPGGKLRIAGIPEEPHIFWLRQRTESATESAARRSQRSFGGIMSRVFGGRKTSKPVPRWDQIAGWIGGIIDPISSSSSLFTVLDLTPKTGPIELPDNPVPRSADRHGRAFGYSGETSQNTGLDPTSIQEIRENITREFATGPCVSPKGKSVAKSGSRGSMRTIWTQLPMFYQDVLSSCRTGDSDYLFSLLHDDDTSELSPTEDLPPLCETQSTSRPASATAQLPLLLGFLYCLHLGHEETACVLINSPRFDINGQIRLGVTPLMYATKRNHTRIVQEILDRPDVETDLVDLMQRSVLHHAAVSENINMIELILGIRTTSLNDQDYAGMTPLQVVILRRLWWQSLIIGNRLRLPESDFFGKSLEIVKLLLYMRRDEFLSAHERNYDLMCKAFANKDRVLILYLLREWTAAFDFTRLECLNGFREYKKDLGLGLTTCEARERSA